MICGWQWWGRAAACGRGSCWGSGAAPAWAASPGPHCCRPSYTASLRCTDRAGGARRTELSAARGAGQRGAPPGAPGSGGASQPPTAASTTLQQCWTAGHHLQCGPCGSTQQKLCNVICGFGRDWCGPAGYRRQEKLSFCAGPDWAGLGWAAGRLGAGMLVSSSGPVLPGPARTLGSYSREEISVKV